MHTVTHTLPKLLLASLLLIACAGEAMAIPPPKTDAQLLEESDLVARVRILSVACIGALPDFQTKQALKAYHAKAELLEVKKGKAKAGDIVIIEFNELPEGLVGPWTVNYYPGEEMWTHLKSRGENYRSTWWNSRGPTIKPAAIAKLPAAPGDVLEAPGE